MFRPAASTPLLKPSSSSTPRGTPVFGPISASVSPMMGGLSGTTSPMMSGLAGLISLEADATQPHAMLRSHEFKSGRRVFHVHFGHGFVRSLEGEAPKADGTEPPPPPEAHRVLTPKTHNINVHFDNPKYKSLRLRAFYAVPKMVVIPSAAALRRQKLMQAVDTTPPSEIQRVSLVRSLLATGSLRAACALVARWGLQRTFDPQGLVERLLQAKCYNAAVRFAREFGLGNVHPAPTLLRRMLDEKHYDGALKHIGSRTASIDGEVTPADVLQKMVGEGNHAVALKYVHKFKASERFPPSQLVSSCLASHEDLTVRTCGMLLKYVKVFGLENTYPMAHLLERVAASGVTVHEMDGKYVLKGRRRQSSSQPQTNSGSASLNATPGGSPVVTGLASSAPA